MLIDVILENAPGSVLASERISCHDESAVDDMVSNVLEGWILSVGDTIRIVEVEG